MITADDLKPGTKLRWTFDGTNGIRGMRRGYEGVIQRVLAVREAGFSAIIDWDQSKTAVELIDYAYRFAHLELAQPAVKGYVRGDQGMFGNNRPKTIWDLVEEQEKKNVR